MAASGGRRPRAPRRVVRLSLVVAELGGGRATCRVSTFVWRWCRWTRWPLTGAIVAVAALTVGFDVITAWLGVNLGSPRRRARSRRRCRSRSLLVVPWSAGAASASTAPTSRPGASSCSSPAPRWLFGVSQYSRAHRRLRRGDGPRARRARRGDRVPPRGADPGRRVRRPKLSGRNWRNAEDWGVGPGLAAIVASGLVFTVLPGHVAQMSDTLHALPFVCLGMVLGYAMLRTGALLPAVVVHALLNLATIAAFDGRDLARGAHRARRRPRSSRWCSAPSWPAAGSASSGWCPSWNPPPRRSVAGIALRGIDRGDR